ncbi:hypothetical protein ACFSJ3_10770 [Corallincola platygyrae]|uniref:Transmembrane protein n=1 Tax=Corallincola platygyrae TaxID=1193278 RepID=A0ABW4XMX5_9GAMM
MLVPKYWAEAKSAHRINGKSFTLKRFGWSDTGETDAQRHAAQRLKEAEAELFEEGTVRRVDHKVSYNGAEGLPIREEQLAIHGDVVVSRNAYGARCLNTPNVLFADIDVKTGVSLSEQKAAFFLLAALAATALVLHWSWWLLLAVVIAVISMTTTVAEWIHLIMAKSKPDPFDLARQKIEQVAVANPNLHLRLYQTPMGYRVLVMNQLFAPASEEAKTLMAALGTDDIYMLMCKNQHCFRARLTAKPWRIGVDRLRPVPGVWPVNPSRLDERKQWVSEYEAKAKHFAACHYIAQFGPTEIIAEAKRVMELHDKECRAENTALPLA